MSELGRKKPPSAAKPPSQRRRQPAGPAPSVDGAGPDGIHERVIIEGVRPEVDEGRFPAKAVVGEKLTVEADVYADGHEAISCVLLYRKEGDADWIETPMEATVNDRWWGEFTVTELAPYRYTIEAWIDPFQTWRNGLLKRIEAGQDVKVDFRIGAGIIGHAAKWASGADAERLRKAAERLSSPGRAPVLMRQALDHGLAETMARNAGRSGATRYQRELRVAVDPPKAGFSSWYEMFPRSCAPEAGRHGTFADVEARLPYVAEMGFDVLYFPPIHPIGRTHRKGKNNAVKCEAGEPGSPWAIGSDEGGHKAVHPQLGTIDGFRRLVAKAKERGIDVALDIALQCSPDHPYVREHPQWFRRRPDGTVQYAENPPKKYEDIYPLDFETDDWLALWDEVTSIFLFWIEQGVRIFRVDNPHTKPFSFWEWLIAEVRRDHPDVILLSEAFTRPKIMYHLAKLGFTQSYTYFAWRNTKWELTNYFTELAQTEVADFFRPSVWPNTPDILTEHVQTGGRPAFMARLVLAATLSANYGVYGPAFELCERTPRQTGGEEYLDSEKYEIKRWDIDRPDSLRGLIARVNGIRRENAALQSNRSLRFHHVDNEQIICYSKQTEDLENVVVTVVNLDYRRTQSGWVHLPVEQWGIGPDDGYDVRDLLTGAVYTWHGPRNYVELDPASAPAHIFRLERRAGRR